MAVVLSTMRAPGELLKSCCLRPTEGASCHFTFGTKAFVAPIAVYRGAYRYLCHFACSHLNFNLLELYHGFVICQ